MKICEVQIVSATLKRDCFVNFILSAPSFGRKFSFDMSKDCDRRRLNLLFDYAQVTDIYELNGKFVKLAVNEQNPIKTDFIAIGHPSADKFFMLEATQVVETSSADVEKIYSESK